MGLFGALGTLFGLPFAVVADEIRVQSKIARNVAQMERNGEFLPTNVWREREIIKMVDKNWRQDKSLYPEYMRPFLEEAGGGAVYVYGLGIARQMCIKEGIRPSGFINPAKADFFHEFESCYRDKYWEWEKRTYPEVVAQREADRKADAKKMKEDARKRDLRNYSWIAIVSALAFFGALALMSLPTRTDGHTFGVLLLLCSIIALFISISALMQA